MKQKQKGLKKNIVGFEMKDRNKLYEALVVSKRFYPTTTRSNTSRFFKG
ncbi:hypothetical protein [Clostridium sp. DJ247]|nr:hypothetical protein [Clostridium sp. DJ247]MBC2578837.1 hypothetical protein [Clostridium sp. DJ247]